MSFAVKQLRHHAQGHGLRLDFLAPDSGKTVLLQSRKLFLRISRMQDEVAVDIKRFIHGESKSVEVYERPIKICSGVEVGAERFQLFADLERVARGRAFFQHAL